MITRAASVLPHIVGAPACYLRSLDRDMMISQSLNVYSFVLFKSHRAAHALSDSEYGTLYDEFSEDEKRKINGAFFSVT